MELQSQQLENIEKKIWQMVLLTVVVILFLTLTLLSLQFYGYIQDAGSVQFSQGPYKYYVFLAIIVLLFCVYMITQHRKITEISRAFFNEKETVEMLSQDVRILSSLLEVSSSMSSQQNLTDILNTITREIISCFNADHASLMLLNQASKMIETKASIGAGSEIVKEAVIPMGESVAGYVMKIGKPLLLSGKVDPAEFPGTREKDRHITSSMCVPLKIGGQSIGVLNVNLVESDRTFSENDLKLIAVFANNAAVAINDARLYSKITSFNVQLEEKVRERTQELEAANRVKSNFLSSVSHELRTPLNAIAGFSDVLLDKNFGPLNKDQEKFAQNIAHSSSRLEGIIDDILDVSKLEAGDLKLNITPVQVEKLLKDGMGQFKDEIDKKRIRIDLQHTEDLENLRINADEEKLRQVIYHLLSNAVKFTPEKGEISVEAVLISDFGENISRKGAPVRSSGPTPVPSSGATGQAGQAKTQKEINDFQSTPVEYASHSTGQAIINQHAEFASLLRRSSEGYEGREAALATTAESSIQISVADSGIGLSPDDQKEVFKDFYQVKGGISDKTPGTGMGLSLTKRLVELHGGTIWVESEGMGKGSRFAFVLPLQ